MKIGFLIFSHREPTQLLRLLRTIRTQLPDSPLVVHHDVFSTNLEPSALEAVSDAHLITSERPVVWGDFSQVESCWRSLSWMTDNLEFDWVVLLSAQDYPIKPLRDLPNFLATTRADALLSASPIAALSSAAERRNRRRRYLYRYNMDGRRSSRSAQGGLRMTMRGPLSLPADVVNNIQPYLTIYKFPDGLPWRLGYRARHTPFAPDWPCWFGSGWFALSRTAVRYLLEFLSGHPEYVEYFRHTVCPDEAAIATIICNAQQLRVEAPSLHYVRWTKPESGHPDVLTQSDLSVLISSGKFFARKFDALKDSEILDQLDYHMKINQTMPQ